MKCSIDDLLPLDAQEQQARILFEQWQRERQEKLALSNNRLPVSRPQGYTIALKDFVISASEVFRPGYRVALTKHPRYFTSVLHAHDFFEVVYCCEGHCRQLIDHREFALEKGDMCILPPGVVHAPEAFGPKDIAINIQLRKQTFWDTFENILPPGNAISDFFLRVVSQKHPDLYLVFQMPDDTEILNIVLTMYAEQQKHLPYDSTVLDAYTALFFSLILRNHSQDVAVYSVSGGSSNKTIVSILRYLEEHPAEASLAVLAEKFGYSQSHLSRMIKQYTGDNYSVFRRKLRMARAALLLEQTDSLIPAIASEVGYASLSDFYKFFKEAYQMTPQEYRAKHTGGR